MTFGEWNRQHLEDLHCSGIVSGVEDAQLRTKNLNKTFAEMFEGSADETAQKMIAEGFCDLRTCENLAAFNDAYSAGETKEGLMLSWA